MKSVTSASAGSAIEAPQNPGLDLSEALKGRIEPVRASMAYRAGLLLVAVAMLVLPVIYLSLVALVCCGIYWHAVNDVNVLSARVGWAALIAYFGPIFVGLILLGFMVKPFLARQRDDSVPLMLRQMDEPALFEFVYRLCRVLGAPAPARINVDLTVNASASFRNGLRGMLSRELVLTIGLPLAACMDARQFAGVLAHELGHFSQGSAMRLTYIVRRVNAWFARIVYHRDHWDRVLVGLTSGDGNWAIMLVALTARGMISIVRRILWCFMIAGHAVSSIMLRQMEFDADGYQCRVAGSDSFAQTFQRLQCLAIAQAAAFSDLTAAWRERRLADDLLAFIRARETDMPADVRMALQDVKDSGKTGWFDSHPSDADRLAAAKRQNQPGIFSANAPAADLFANFTELSRVATMLFYRENLGRNFQPAQLVQSGALVEARVEQEQSHDALARYFRGLIDPVRPVFPAATLPPAADRGAAAEQLLDLRCRLQEQEHAASEAAAQHAQSVQRRMMVTAVRELRTAGFSKAGVKDPAIESMSDEALDAAASDAKVSCERAAAVIERALRIGMDRLALALSLEKPRESLPRPAPQASEDEDFGEYDLAEEIPAGAADQANAALNAMRSLAADFESLRWHVFSLGLLLARINPQGNPRPLVNAVLWHSRKAAGLLREIYRCLGNVSYPYVHADNRLTLASYIIPAMPPPEAAGRVGAAAEAAIDAYRSLYHRLMADLATRAEAVEAELGLPPMG